MKCANRILLLVTQADWGGVQSFLIKFGAELRAEGREVLLAAGGDGELWDEAAKAGIPTRRLIKMTRKIHPLKDWSAINELQQLLHEFKPDAVHLNSSKMGVLGSMAVHIKYRSAKSHPTVVYRIGGWSFFELVAKWKLWIYRTAEYLTASYKDVIITVHPEDETIARKLKILPRKAIITVPNGLNIPTFVARLLPRAEARTTLNIPEHAFVFGTIANAYAYKGLLPYLDVVARVLAEDRHAVAVIIGDGPQYSALQAHRDTLNVRDRIVLAGYRDDAERLAPAFDVFVLPSCREGMPWALLEAMAAGIPSITTDVGGCRWVLKADGVPCSGIIVPKKDPLALQEAMRRLRINDEERTALGKGAKENVSRRFSWKATYTGNRDALDGVITS